jgi:hypothetical protein
LIDLPEKSEKNIYKPKALKMRLRFDYRGEKSGGLFGRKNSENVAEDKREHVAALLRNVPRRGITIEEIDINHEVYTILDEETGNQAAYAPLEILVKADRIEDIMEFIMRPEFRRIEVLQPQEILLTDQDIERMLYKVNEELHNFTQILERRLNSK